MLIATFNCNSIRSRLGIVLDWLESHRPDVLALQETKCADDPFPAEAFEQAGWHIAYRGEKRYNGVAMITPTPPDEVHFGLEDGDDGVSETRLARIRVGKINVLNTYVPQGRDLADEQFQFKVEWLTRVQAYLAKHFDPQRDRLVWVGDLNIAPTPGDVYDSETLWPNVCHCRQVSDVYDALLEWGLVDIFRKHIPNEGVFTFWDYRLPHGVSRNLGWRLDHILATPPMAETSTECLVDTGPRRAEKPSDHTFVAARFDANVS